MNPDHLSPERIEDFRNGQQPTDQEEQHMTNCQACTEELWMAKHQTMNTEEFKPGDQVQLKSGGPIMTVKEANKFIAYCVYADTHNVCRDQVFSIHTLRLIKDFITNKTL